jgi:hypothetical protein
MRVYIYRNLSAEYRGSTRKVYSVRTAQGKVIAHVSDLVLKDVKFVVWGKKRKRVLRQCRRWFKTRFNCRFKTRQFYRLCLARTVGQTGRSGFGASSITQKHFFGWCTIVTVFLPQLATG